MNFITSDGIYSKPAFSFYSYILSYPLCFHYFVLSITHWPSLELSLLLCSIPVNIATPSITSKAPHSTASLSLSLTYANMQLIQHNYMCNSTKRKKIQLIYTTSNQNNKYKWKPPTEYSIQHGRCITWIIALHHHQKVCHNVNRRHWL